MSQQQSRRRRQHRQPETPSSYGDAQHHCDHDIIEEEELSEASEYVSDELNDIWQDGYDWIADDYYAMLQQDAIYDFDYRHGLSESQAQAKEEQCRRQRQDYEDDLRRAQVDSQADARRR